MNLIKNINSDLKQNAREEIQIKENEKQIKSKGIEKNQDDNYVKINVIQIKFSKINFVKLIILKHFLLWIFNIAIRKWYLKRKIKT